MSDRRIDELPVKSAAQLALTDYLVGHDDGVPAGFRSQLGELKEFFSLVMPSGTFTPTLGGNADDPTVTYGTRQGVWARVGPLVFVYVRVDWTALSGGGGNVRIRGLDAPPTPDTSFAQILTGRTSGVDFGTGRSAIYASFSGASELAVTSYGSGVGTQSINLGHLGSTGSFLFQGVYLTTDPLP